MLIQANQYITEGSVVLMYGGQIVWVGRMANMGNAAKKVDKILVNYKDYERIKSATTEVQDEPA